MDSASGLMLAMLFGAIGFSYFVYGKKQRNGVAFAAGVFLCIFPFFITNIWIMIAIGVFLTCLPLIVRN